MLFNQKKLSHLLWLLAGSFLFSACAPATMYRPVLEDASADTTYADCSEVSTNNAHAIEHHERYLLGFVEFDDQGQLWCRQQMHAVLAAVEKAAANPAGAIIIVYSHGWKHNASVDDSRIDQLKQLLLRLSDTEESIKGRLSAQEKNYQQQKVIGIYVGWRGNSVSIPYVDNLTFWNRKNLSEKVGRIGLTELLSRVEKIQNNNKKCHTDKAVDCSDKVKLVLIGNSLGASVMYSAASAILENRFIQSDEGQLINGLGNLLILINPAIEANMFTSLKNMSSERKNYAANQRALVAVLTSKGDYTTKHWFKAGRTLSTLFEPHGKRSHFNAYKNQIESIDLEQTTRTALGHFSPYISDELSKAASERDSTDTTSEFTSPSATFTPETGTNNRSDMVVEDFISRQPQENVNRLSTTADHDEKKYGSFIIKSNNMIAPNNPYRVISVNTNIIKGHNDIYSPELVDFFSGMILDSTVSNKIRQQLQNTRERRDKK